MAIVLDRGGLHSLTKELTRNHVINVFNDYFDHYHYFEWSGILISSFHTSSFSERRRQ